MELLQGRRAKSGVCQGYAYSRGRREEGVRLSSRSDIMSVAVLSSSLCYQAWSTAVVSQLHHCTSQLLVVICSRGYSSGTNSQLSSWRYAIIVLEVHVSILAQGPGRDVRNGLIVTDLHKRT
jgi:hypothetical protein